MTILILLHRSKFVAQAVPRRRLRLYALIPFFEEKGLLRDVGVPSPNISGKPFQDNYKEIIG